MRRSRVVPERGEPTMIGIGWGPAAVAFRFESRSRIGIHASAELALGMDVVPELIEHNRRHHLTDRRSFVLADISRDLLPPAEVILCRDCLVHFSIEDVWTTLSNFRRSGSRYLLTTTFVERDTNGDIRTGSWQPLNLQAAPFNFPLPLALVDERCSHTGGIYRDKRLGLWELASLPSRSHA